MNKNSTDQLPANCSIACSLNRRHFLHVLAGGMGLAILGGCTQGNSQETAPLPMAVAKDNGWTLSGAAGLSPGQALAFRFPDDSPGLVFLTAQNQWRAISAKCTHAGCTVQWQDGKELLCPCHHSRFDLAGKVLSGPATKPLPLYSAKRQGEDIVIKAA